MTVSPGRTLAAALLRRAFALAALSMSTPSMAEDVLTTALKSGKPLFAMRGRVELVDDESNTLDDATAFTVRTFFGYETGSVNGFSARIAAENVTHLIDDFNVPGEPSSGYDVVADPQGTEIDEAFLRYQSETTTVTAGRQYLTYRKAPFHRFIGTVPWRQNWQSMDALAIENRSIDKLRINYAYVNKVNRIFGNDNPNKNLASSPMSSHLINLQYSGLPIGELEGYYYRLDYDVDTQAAAFTDRETYGAKLQGKKPVGEDLAATYLLELSHQRAIEDNPTDFDSANQYRLELGLTKTLGEGAVKAVTAKFGYEVLESDGGASFSTPLATVHAFQGWADRFIGFPGAGVKDTYLVGAANFTGNMSLLAIYHSFEADEGGFDYGDEFDVQLSKKFGKFTVALKHASYFGDEDPAAGATGIDKTVTWAWINYEL